MGWFVHVGSKKTVGGYIKGTLTYEQSKPDALRQAPAMVTMPSHKQSKLQRCHSSLIMAYARDTKRTKDSVPALRRVDKMLGPTFCIPV